MSNVTPIVFVGGGQMATALIRGLLQAGRDASSMVVLEPNSEQREKLARTFGVRTMEAPGEGLGNPGTVIWAVKPQVLRPAIEAAITSLSGALHISIVAGVASATLSHWLASDRVIRVMPNTPALIGAGVAGMFAMGGTSATDRSLAEEIFGITGYCFWVESDERIDAVTAISGSGPGYVFEFLESFQRAAQMIGFSEVEARMLVVRTTLGAAQQAATDTTALSVLRDRVASKGGTTEAGLKALAEYQFPRAIELAVSYAYKRAQELSQLLRDDPLNSSQSSVRPSLGQLPLTLNMLWW